jgi:hypothetical protein
VEGSHRLGLVGPAPLAAADGPGTERTSTPLSTKSCARWLVR